MNLWLMYKYKYIYTYIFRTRMINSQTFFAARIHPTPVKHGPREQAIATCLLGINFLNWSFCLFFSSRVIITSECVNTFKHSKLYYWSLHWILFLSVISQRFYLKQKQFFRAARVKGIILKLAAKTSGLLGKASIQSAMHPINHLSIHPSIQASHVIVEILTLRKCDRYWFCRKNPHWESVIDI